MTSARRTQVVVAGVIGAVALAITVGAYFGHVLRPLEEQSIDKRFSIRGSEGAPSDVVAVAVDDATFASVQKSWPFPRCLHAQVLDRIARGNPRAIAVDIQFTEQSTAKATDGESCDDKLILAVQRAGHVVLTTTETNAQG